MRRARYSPRYAIGANYGGGIFTPQTVKDEIQTTSGLMLALDRDIKASGASPTFKLGWDEFAKEWVVFADNHSGILGYPSLALNSTYAKVLEYRERYDSWRAKLSAEGGNASTPVPPSAEKEHGKDRGLLGGVSWTTVGISAAAIVGIGWYLSRRE